MLSFYVKHDNVILISASRRSPSDGESDSDEDEQVLWHEQRRRIKEALRLGQPVPDISTLEAKNK